MMIVLVVMVMMMMMVIVLLVVWGKGVWLYWCGGAIKIWVLHTRPRFLLIMLIFFTIFVFIFLHHFFAHARGLFLSHSSLSSSWWCGYFEITIISWSTEPRFNLKDIDLFVLEQKVFKCRVEKHNFDKYIWQVKQIYLISWTNTFCNLNKYKFIRSCKTISFPRWSPNRGGEGVQMPC